MTRSFYKKTCGEVLMGVVRRALQDGATEDELKDRLRVAWLPCCEEMFSPAVHDFTVPREGYEYRCYLDVCREARVYFNTQRARNTL